MQYLSSLPRWALWLVLGGVACVACARASAQAGNAGVQAEAEAEVEAKAESAPSSRFSGLIRSRASAEPVPGIAIVLDDGQSAISDQAGRFRFDTIEPGTHRVTLVGDRLADLESEEIIEAGQALDVIYDVDLEPEAGSKQTSPNGEIVVSAPRLRRQSVSTRVSADEARKIPGTGGDVLRVVESLPGVARSSAGSGDLVVWGAAAEDTRVYVDGVRVPRLYHDGGLRSILSSELVDSVDLVPGAEGAAFGRALGGLVTVATRPIDETSPHGSVSLDLYDAAAAVRAPLAEGLHVALAARRSHLAELWSGVLDDDVEDYFPIPRYYDAQAKLRYQIDPRSSLELTGLVSGDRISRTATDPDPDRTARETRSLAFQRLYLGYRTETASGEALAVTAWFGADQSDLSQQQGVIPTELHDDVLLGGVRTSWRTRASEWLSLEFGLDAEISRSSLQRSGSVAAPPREGDIRVFGQPPPDRINADSWRATAIGVAPYAEAHLELLDKRLHVYPGLRLDPNATVVSRRLPVERDLPTLGRADHDLELEPRLSLRFAISDSLTVKAAWGSYHQAPQSEDLSATFGNPALGASRAMHWVLGGSWSVTDDLVVELTGFYVRSNDLAVRSPLASPLAAEALVQTGEGRAYGQQLLLRHDFSGGFFGWLSYSLVRSQRRSGPDSDFRAFDFDQTHVLTALASYEFGAGFQVGARFRYATGFPRTPVADAFYDARRDRYQPIFGEQNRIRIPPFLELSLRGSKQFEIGDTNLEVYLELQNVTNRENAEEIIYNHDYTERDYITGLPILPVLGVLWSF
jgi:hypothetical protein